MKIATVLSEGSQTPTLCWLSTTSLKIADLEGELSDMEFTEPYDLPAVESEHVAFVDVLESDMSKGEVEDFDSMDYVTDAHAVIVWEPPEVR
jgi:hypothetical protein